MCGQCGVIADWISQNETAMFKMLLRLNAFRGPHSTGVLGVSKPGLKSSKVPLKPTVWKEARDSWEYLYFADLDKKERKKELFTTTDKRLLMGHCRWATVGKISAKNAHPFVFPNVIGMHNGTIKKKFKGADDFETDSEALYKLINDVGPKEALQEVETFDSAYALQWFDLKNATVNFVRNDKRPLHFAYTQSRQALFWSSDKDDLEYAAKKTGINLSFVFEPKPYILHQFDLSADVPHKEIGTTDLTPKKIQTHIGTSTGGELGKRYDGGEFGKGFNYYGNGRRWNHTLMREEIRVGTEWIPITASTALIPWEDEDAQDAAAAEAIAEYAKRRPERKTLERADGKTQDVFRGFNGRSLMYRDFEMILCRGCANCTQSPDINTEGLEYKIGWHDAQTFLCDQCMQNKNVQDFMVTWQNTEPQTVSEDI